MKILASVEMSGPKKIQWLFQYLHDIQNLMRIDHQWTVEETKEKDTWDEHSFTHLFNKYLMNTYQVLYTAPHTGDTAVNKVIKIFAPMAIIFYRRCERQ